MMPGNKPFLAVSAKATGDYKDQLLGWGGEPFSENASPLDDGPTLFERAGRALAQTRSPGVIKFQLS